MNETNYPELENLVKELVCVAKTNIDKTESVVSGLQRIGEKLLTEYEIKIDINSRTITIEPLRLEPYLFCDGFEDKFMHYIYIEKDNMRFYGPRQRNHFGKLYIHSGYSGVDLVISNNENYAFSFLVKNSRILVDGEIVLPFTKQYGVAKLLKDYDVPIDYDEVVLSAKKVPNKSIVFQTIRNGLLTISERDDFSKKEQDRYNELLISSFIELKEHTSRQFDFATGYGGDRAVVEYLKKYKKEHPEACIDELDHMRKQLFPNGSKSEFVKEFKK